MEDKEKKEASTWGDDFNDFTKAFQNKKIGKVVLFVVFALFFFLLGGFLFSSHNQTPTVLSSSPSSSVEKVSPTPSPSVSPTQKPVVSDQVTSMIPTSWVKVQEKGCKQAWTAPSSGVSSILVLNRATKAFKNSGFNSHSTWGEDSLTIEATGDQDGITHGLVVFTKETIKVCLS